MVILDSFSASAGRPALRTATLLVVLAALCTGCDVVDEQLRPYEGERPFIIQRVTQSWSPDVQWVGGRAAAVGVNKGAYAALDSTLVWMRRLDGDAIDSPISINEQFDRDAVAALGGEPADSLESGAVYTIWIASAAALEANLDTTAVDEFALVDSTFESSYLLLGRSGGGVSVDFTIVRNESLTSDAYIVDWTPSDLGFNQLAIRESSSGGFTDLRWHIVMPDDSDAKILPPLIIGDTPPGAVVGTEWGGWGSSTHTLWATTDEWNGTDFRFRTPGYAFFQAFASNFQ